MSWYLVVSSGPSSISAFQLVGPGITIGRMAENDIVLDDNTVAHHHARLDMQADTYVLTDLGSADGTWVNGRRISAPVLLRAGDSVRFGERLVFVFSTQPSLGGVVPGRAPMRPEAPFWSQPAAGGGLPGWFLAIGGALAILVVILVAALIVLLVLPSRVEPTPTVVVSQPTARPITAVPMGPTTTPMPTEAPTATFSPMPTNTPTLTPVPPTRTPGAWVQVMAAAKAGPPVFGPDSGSLSHEEDGSVEAKRADVDLRDFVVEAVFYNPYPTTRGAWDIGFLFRDAGKNDEFRLAVESDGDWSLNDRRGGENNFIDKGQASNLDASAGSLNRLTLIAEGDRGFFFVNDTFIAELDLSSRTNSGDISAAIEIASDHEVDGEVTAYENLTIWSLMAQGQQATSAKATDTPIAPPPLTSTLTVSLPTPTPTRKPASAGLIAFVSNRDGNDEIYVMNPDGSNQRRLTNTPGEDWHPAWLPDGTRILFQCTSGGTFNVCVINADGSGYTQITNWTKDEGLAQRPVWSPDGSKIVVTCLRPLGGGWTANLDDEPRWVQRESVDPGRSRPHVPHLVA
jgi:hypothetical protein